LTGVASNLTKNLEGADRPLTYEREYSMNEEIQLLKAAYEAMERVVKAAHHCREAAAMADHMNTVELEKVGVAARVIITREPSYSVEYEHRPGHFESFLACKKATATAELAVEAMEAISIAYRAIYAAHKASNE